MRRRVRSSPPRHAALIAALVVALAGCAGNDDAADAEPEDDGAAPTEDENDDEGADDGSGADDTAGVVQADVTDENGMATLRPPADAVPDCDAIDELAPGASLTFPTDEAGMLDAGPGPVTVEFVGCSNTFEANLVYDAFHGEDRTPTITEFTMGGTMGDWGEFRFEETFWTPGAWTVVVYEDDAATGERQEYDQVTFSIS